MEGFARFPMETYPRLASELGFSEQDGPRREHIEVLCRLASPDAMSRALWRIRYERGRPISDDDGD